MIEYRARVTIEINDEYNMHQLDPVTVHVKFKGDGDPRELLSRLALEKAVEAAEAAERFMS